jgi:hypothetical protein
MEKEQALAIAEKYRNMSQDDSTYGADQCALFEQYAEIIEEEINLFVEDDSYETEADVVEFAKETYSMGIDHYDREDYINMGLLDEPCDE